MMIYILYFDHDGYTNFLHLPKFTELLIKRLKFINCIFKSKFWSVGEVGQVAGSPDV